MRQAQVKTAYFYQVFTNQHEAKFFLINKHLLLQNGYVLYEARDSAKINLTKRISFWIGSPILDTVSKTTIGNKGGK